MKNIKQFETWLSEHGAVIKDPTNEWEVIRFQTEAGVSVIYKRKTGHLTFTGEADEAYRAYQHGAAWRAVPIKRKNLKSKKEKLARRDGKWCFFCHGRYDLDKLTIEHLLNKSQGGTDHEYNLCLACEPCNTAVKNWPLTKKMLWRDQKLNKSEGEIVKQTAASIYSLFDDRTKQLSKFGILRTSSLQIELRHIIKSMGVDV
jgi:hypothetical protein